MWIRFSPYRHSEEFFFRTNSNVNPNPTPILSKALLKYEKKILMIVFNNDAKCKDIRRDKSVKLCDAFNLKNLVKCERCLNKDHNLIDLVLTNNFFSFQRT